LSLKGLKNSRGEPDGMRNDTEQSTRKLSKEIVSDAEWFIRTPVLLSEVSRISESANSHRDSLFAAFRPALDAM
jgi:hypothetical protein